MSFPSHSKTARRVRTATNSSACFPQSAATAKCRRFAPPTNSPSRRPRSGCGSRNRTSRRTMHSCTSLKNAAQRGVDVRIIVPATSDSTVVLHSSRYHYGPLLESGVRIFEHRDAMLHAKTAVVDGIWSTVGSSNLDYRSFLHNDEVNAVIVGGRLRQTARNALRGGSGGERGNHAVAVAQTRTSQPHQRILRQRDRVLALAAAATRLSNLPPVCASPGARPRLRRTCSTSCRTATSSPRPVHRRRTILCRSSDAECTSCC